MLLVESNSQKNTIKDSVCLFWLCSIFIRLTALIKHHLFSVVKETQSEYFITMFCLHSCHEIIQFQYLEPVLPQILSPKSDASYVCVSSTDCARPREPLNRLRWPFRRSGRKLKRNWGQQCPAKKRWDPTNQTSGISWVV